ncbi:MAG: hypothetical protein WC785_07610 [Tatlockia sp.]|jgi:hypothetical protein
MQPCQWEIIILKPTRVFLSFLASQLPGIALPDFRTLQLDPGAYVIRKCDSDEETFNEIEYHFATMFRREIQRWVAEGLRDKIEGSFLDFLCCFKFELHSRIILMEPEYKTGQHVLRIKPRSVLLTWLKSATAEQTAFRDVLDKVTVSNLGDNCTAIVRHFTCAEEIKAFLREQYQDLFETEMFRVCEQKKDWPLVNSYQDFCRYFSVQTHTNLVHLA